ncbi:MAG: hypothetical protein WD552_01255 [Candidatus Paceibacterota bacterium]
MIEIKERLLLRAAYIVGLLDSYPTNDTMGHGQKKVVMEHLSESNWPLGSEAVKSENDKLVLLESLELTDIVNSFFAGNNFINSLKSEKSQVEKATHLCRKMSELTELEIDIAARWMDTEINEIIRQQFAAYRK